MGLFDGIRNAWNFLSNFPNMDDMFGIRERQIEEISRHIDYREGRQTPQLKVKFNKPDDNVQNNIIGRAINQSLTLLLSKGVWFDLPNENKEEDTDEQKWIDACWKANSKTLLMNDACLNAADSGAGFIKIQREGVTGMLDGKEAVFPRLILIDSRWVIMQTNPEDYEQVIAYIIQYHTTDTNGKAKQRKQEILHVGVEYDEKGNVVDDGDYWETTDYEKSEATRGKWLQIGEPERWDYTFAPIQHWKNLPNPNDIWGRPDADESILNLQDKLNFNLSNLNKIIRYHAHPKTIGKGIGKGSDIEVSPDGMFIIPADSDISNLEMKTDLASALETIDYLGKAVLDNMNTVDINNVRDRSGQLTNFAIQVMFFDAMSKMDVKREIWTEWLLDINHRLFTVGYENGESVDVGNVEWPDNVLPINDKELSEVYKNDLEQKLVSKQTVSTNRGYDWEDEQDRMAKEEVQTDNVAEALLRGFDRGQL